MAKLSNQTLPILLGLMVIISAATTCSGSKTSPAVVEPIKIVIFVGFSTGSESGQVAVHETLRDEFNKQHPDIQIEFQTVDYMEHDRKFLESLAKDSPPDLVFPISIKGIASYFDEWLDLGANIAKEDISDFYPQAVEALKLNGKSTGLPLGVYPSVLFYNADLFDRAKIPWPPQRFDDSGWTYDKLVHDARQLTRDNNGKTPTDKSFDPTRIVQYGYAGTDWSAWKVNPGKFGGSITGLSSDYRYAHLNSSAWKQAFQFLYESIFAWYIRPQTLNGHNTLIYGDSDPIGSGKIAMWECYSWIQYAWRSWSNAFKWNVAAIPAGPSGKILAQANLETFAIPKSAKHPEQAWTVIKWFLQAGNLKRLSLAYGCVPARRSLADGWLQDQKKQNAQINWGVFLDAIKYMDNPNAETWTPAYKKIDEAIERTASSITAGATTDVSAASEALNTEVQGYLDDYWKNQPKQ